MRIRFATGLAVLLIGAAAAPAAAQPQTTTTTMTVSVSSLAKLTVSSSALTFPDANPDVAPQVAALQGALSITAKARAAAGSQILLTLQASDDLRSGVQVIPASAISWTTTGTGFTAGTLSKVASVALGRWTGSGVWSGTQTLSFSNLWTYSTGTYTCVLVYTLAGP